MRKPLIIANWKMNTTLSDAVVLATSVKNNVADLDIDVVICPPSVWLYPVAEILNPPTGGGPRNIKLGAQNMYFTDNGSLTGEISPVMVKALAKYVILGHSERRSHFKESEDFINDKIHAALKHNLIPIVCIGEIKKMHELKQGRGRPSRVDLRSDVVSQLKSALAQVSEDDAEKMVVAYEPVWAIGTGQAATGGYAAGVIADLREVFAKKYNRQLAERVRILYGGSVDSENIKEFIYQPEIDGVLAGTSSLKASEFIKICKEAAGRD